jgi:glyoxylase-like metal-dependent hydrolase (beta-lactamase superfamily II)
VSLAVEVQGLRPWCSKPARTKRAAWPILNETRRLFPQKRIKYVVNTHAHFDHAGACRRSSPKASRIIADDNNKYFLLPALGSPRTLVGDALAKSRKKPVIEGVEKKLVLRDATRTLELHHVEKLEHSDGMLIAYLPKERILFTADFPVPVPGQPVNPSTTTLIENVTRLGLDFDRYVTVHAPAPDRPLTRADLMGPPPTVAPGVDDDMTSAPDGELQFESVVPRADGTADATA